MADRVTDPARRDAFRRRRPRPRHRLRKRGSFWRELPILVVTALILTFLIQTFVARVFVIPSASMEHTLHGCDGCNNDRILVDKLVYDFTSPEPGDVVVFRGPDSWVDNSAVRNSEPDNIVLHALQEAGALVGLAPPDERDFVKRVIATGGQTVRCCDAQNRVVVNGEPLEEPYVYRMGGQPQESFGPVTVPEGTLWVMGDNRNNSADSRAHMDDPRNGAIPVENVIGKARAIVLPPSRWGGIEDPNPQQAMALGAPVGQGAVPAAAGLLVAWPVVRGGRALRVRLTRRFTVGAVTDPRTSRSACSSAPILRPPRAVVRRSSGNWTLQATLQRRGLGPVAGVDEAGRGACAGPLVIAACVLRPADAAALEGLTDSKLLSPQRRERFFELVVGRAVARNVVVVPPAEVDVAGVHVANVEGMRRAVAGLAVQPGYVLTDGFGVPGLTAPSLAVIDGDQAAACVAAASVLAKVTRDRMMTELHETLPQYGFGEHKGYCTSAHTAALMSHGPCEQHRFSYVNVAAAARHHGVEARELPLERASSAGEPATTGRVVQNGEVTCRLETSGPR